ncbi:L-methionine/branched-chain amino acid transporter [Gynuella sp.]|uniref:L-methionine/branched-chain amino acid transporter n=1 Tax=Gynuella sp. TaxID=2969146 RepID=UPI003D149C46
MQPSSTGIGRWQGIGLLVTTMLGTGVFVLPQLTLQQAGSLAMWSWGLLVIAMLPITRVFAILGQHYPHAGGPAQFVERAFSPRQGRIIGLLFLLIVPMGAPAAIELTMEFVNLLVPITAANRLMVELLLVGGILVLNWRGIRASGVWQTALTLIILTIVIALLIFHHPVTRELPMSRSTDHLGAMVSAFGLAMWSFIGIETMTHLVNEFKNPDRDFQVSMMTGLLLVGLIYLGCTWLLLSVPGTADLTMSVVMDEVFGSGGRWIIGIIGTLSGLATVNVYVASISRLMWNLSQQGVLPVQLSHLNRHKIPGNALIAQSVVIAVVLMMSGILQFHYDVLIRCTNGVIVVIYLMSMISAWRLLSRHRLLVLTGGLVCLLFAWSLGIYMLYALLFWGALQLFGLRIDRQAVRLKGS